MNTSNSFDLQKRRTLKIAAGIASSGILINLPAAADAITNAGNAEPHGQIIDCTLISRIDHSRAYLLIRNPSDAEVLVTKFNADNLKFDNTTVNMAEAFTQPVSIASQDRVMVRLNVTPDFLNRKPATENVVDMNHATRYLPQGTRVVTLKVRVEKAKATLDYSRSSIT